MAAERDERVYLPFGHGCEIDPTNDVVPEGCSITVLETCGGLHLWNRIKEESEYVRMKEWLTRNPEKRHIFSNPTAHTVELNDVFGSVAVYGPGKKYPNIKYTFPLLWVKKDKYKQNVVFDVAYSGVIPLASFLNPEFTTTNIVTKLKTNSGEFANPEMDTYPYMGRYSMRIHDICHHNQNEIYKYSIYPSSIQEPGGYHNVTLKELMSAFPGHYIHLVCRTTNESTNTLHKYNPCAETKRTIEEIYTMRIPGMSSHQRNIAIQRMEENKQATDREEKQYNPRHDGNIRTQKHLHSTYNRHSSKNNSTIRLAALQKRKLQNEIRAKAERVYLPFGHGREIHPANDVVPEGCSITVLETCGGLHLWSVKSELVEYTQLKTLLTEYPDKRHIFSNPQQYSDELFALFGPVAIYGPGETYPNLIYTFPLSWDDDIRYSGVIPLRALLDPNFTTKNISKRLLSAQFNNKSNVPDEVFQEDTAEIFKYSVYPTAEMIEESTITLSLTELMNKLPGNYIHITCRAVPSNVNVLASNIHEIYTKRIPYMTPEQRREILHNLEERQRIPKHTRNKARWNKRSTKNTTTNMLIALRKRAVQNEIRARGGTRKRRKH